MSKVDKTIDQLWIALRKPATTVQELAVRVSTLRGEEITTESLDAAIAHLRKNTATYEWTIPHVKRGPARLDDDENISDEGRYIRCLVGRDGTFYFDDDANASRHHDKGVVSVLRHLVTMARNDIQSIKARVANTRSSKKRAALTDLIADYEYATRKTEIVLNIADDEEDVA